MRFKPGKIISANSVNATVLKAGSGTLGYLICFNLNTSARYLKLYNIATAPTVGTTTPVHTFVIPGSTIGVPLIIPLQPDGIYFSAGISLALTTGVADSDSNAVAANEILVNYGYH